MKETSIIEKYSLTIKEAASYFNIGVKKNRRLAEDHSMSTVISFVRGLFNNSEKKYY